MAQSTIKQVTNNSGTGYCKMPDGTLIQWGTATISSGSESVTVDLAMNFYGDYAISALPAFSSDRAASLVFSGRNGNFFKVHTKVNPVTFDQFFAWIAAGRWK